MQSLKFSPRSQYMYKTTHTNKQTHTYWYVHIYTHKYTERERERFDPKTRADQRNRGKLQTEGWQEWRSSTPQNREWLPPKRTLSSSSFPFSSLLLQIVPGITVWFGWVFCQMTRPVLTRNYSIYYNTPKFYKTSEVSEITLTSSKFQIVFTKLFFLNFHWKKNKVPLFLELFCQPK